MGTPRASSSRFSSGDSWANSRTPIHEKGIFFDPNDGEENGFVARILSNYPWSQFVQPPGDFYTDLVFEFYRNLNYNTQVSFVQGVAVNYSSEAINALYNTPMMDDSSTLDFIRNPDLNLIEKTLCPFGANWTMESSGEKGSLRGRNFGYKARAILSFVSSRLLPNTNLCEIFKDRFVLTFVIYNSMPLDVGKFISEQIKNCRFKSKAKALFFPSTITRLILKAGVIPMGAKTPSKILITKSIWPKLGSTDGPWKMFGEEEPFSGRKHNSLMLPEGTPITIGLLMKNVDDIKATLQFQDDQRKAYQAYLDRKVRKMDNYLQQHSRYTTSILWGLSNYVADLGTTLRCCAPIDFLPFVYVDPEPDPTDQSPTETTPQPPVEPPQATPFVAENNLFGDLSDFYNIDDLFEPYFLTNRGPVIQEETSTTKKAKRSREETGKGKAVIKRQDAQYSSDDDWKDVPISRRKDEGSGEGNGGTSRFSGLE